MNYETLDWEAEAARIGRAFGIEAPLRFHQKIKGGYARHNLLNGNDNFIEVREKLYLVVRYKPTDLWFKLQDEKGISWITVSYEGDFCRAGGETNHAEALFKGLFHLGLPKSYPADLFGITITAHQKMEWALEYEARYGL